MNYRLTYITGASSVEQEIERDGRGGVDEEPRLDVVEGDLARLTDHLAVVHVRRAEVDEDVRDEHDVDEHVDH